MRVRGPYHTALTLHVTYDGHQQSSQQIQETHCKSVQVCVVYGALPPEMRRQQARLFNESRNGYDVLVASDAVGMGLNLNIRRIVFHTLQKYEGREMVSKDI